MKKTPFYELCSLPIVPQTFKKVQVFELESVFWQTGVSPHLWFHQSASSSRLQFQQHRNCSEETLQNTPTCGLPSGKTVGIYLHLKLTECIYLNYSSSSSWDDILLRHYHQTTLLKNHENKKFKTFTQQWEVCQLHRLECSPPLKMMKTQCRTNYLVLRLQNPQ